MPIRAGIAYVNAPDAVKSHFVRAVKAANQGTIAEWHRRYLKSHFTSQAFHRYAATYTPRSRQYNRWKLRKLGHRKPLVKTGATQRSTRMSIRLTGTSKSAKGRMHAPWYINVNRHRRDGRRPMKNEEITAVTASEIQTLAQFHDRATTAQLKNQKTQRRVQK